MKSKEITCWNCKHAVFMTRSVDDCDLSDCAKEPEYFEKEMEFDREETLIAKNCRSFKEVTNVRD